MLNTTKVVELLDAASVFMFDSTDDDVELERQRLEAMHGKKLAVHETSYPSYSGARRCRRVEWKVIE